MDAPDQSIVVAMRSLIEANRNVRTVLARAEELLAQGVARLEAGERPTEILATVPASAQRQATQDALDGAAAARHELRLQMIAACLADGMTPRQIADAWGVSRQRADRFVQEIRRGSDDGSTTGALAGDAGGGRPAE